MSKEYVGERGELLLLPEDGRIMKVEQWMNLAIGWTYDNNVVYHNMKPKYSIMIVAKLLRGAIMR